MYHVMTVMNGDVNLIDIKSLDVFDINKITSLERQGIKPHRAEYVKTRIKK